MCLLSFKHSTLVLLNDFLITFTVNIYKVWTALDPLRYTRVTIGRSEDGTLQSVGNCSSSGTASTVTSSLLFALNLVLVIFAGIQVYQTRRVTVAYHESKVSVV